MGSAECNAVDANRGRPNRQVSNRYQAYFAAIDGDEGGQGSVDCAGTQGVDAKNVFVIAENSAKRKPEMPMGTTGQVER